LSSLKSYLSNKPKTGLLTAFNFSFYYNLTTTGVRSSAQTYILSATVPSKQSNFPRSKPKKIKVTKKKKKNKTKTTKPQKKKNRDAGAM
jgi:hypothetical protein